MYLKKKNTAGIQIHLCHFYMLREQPGSRNSHLKPLRCRRDVCSGGWWGIAGDCENRCFEVHTKLETWLSLCYPVSQSKFSFYIYFKLKKKQFHVSLIKIQSVFVFDQDEAWPIEDIFISLSFGVSCIFSSLWLDMEAKLEPDHEHFNCFHVTFLCNSVIVSNIYLNFNANEHG